MRIKLPGSVIKFAYHFFDVEASGETALPDARVIEYPFVLGKLSSMSKGKVLDVGCVARSNYLPATLATLGWEVYGIDAREWKFKFPNFNFVQGDVRHSEFKNNFFDCAYAVSTIGNIGLSGRYGINQDDSEGDVNTIREIFRILKPGGKLLVTLPYGEAYKVVKPWGREYDEQRIKELFNGWKMQCKLVYCKDKDDCWVVGGEQTDHGMALLALEK